VLLFLAACSNCEYEILRTFCLVELIGLGLGLGLGLCGLDYITGLWSITTAFLSSVAFYWAVMLHVLVVSVVFDFVTLSFDIF